MPPFCSLKISGYVFFTEDIHLKLEDQAADNRQGCCTPGNTWCASLLKETMIMKWFYNIWIFNFFYFFSELQRRCAELFGTEAALLLPTGTMGNLIASMCFIALYIILLLCYY